MNKYAKVCGIGITFVGLLFACCMGANGQSSGLPGRGSPQTPPPSEGSQVRPPSSQSGDETPSPQANVVVLRNGRVLQGFVLREDDRIQLTRSDRSVVRIPIAIIDFLAPNMALAYQHQAGRLKDKEARIRLIQWCLQYEMVREVAEQLAVVRFQAPKDSRIAYLDRRIAQRLRPTPRASGVPRSLSADPASPGSVARTTRGRAATPRELNRLVKGLPAGSVEQFTHVIQPMLVNRCGAAACHGVLADSPYRLIRPSIEGAFSHRYTQRNLHSTIKQVRAGALAETEWIRAATTPHGGRKKPFFSENEIDQLGRLVAWARSVSQSPVDHDPIARLLAQDAPSRAEPAANQTTEPRSPAFRPAGFRTSRANPGAAHDPKVDPQVRRASYGQSKDASKAEEKKSDPFDPKAFNREFFPKPKTKSDG